MMRSIKLLLLPLSFIYLLITKLRNKFYDWGIFRSRELGVPVISVGNIAVGGTGKTPFTISLTNYMIDRGFSPVIITRGYKKKSKGQVIISKGEKPLVSADLAGDEPYLMAQRTAACVIADPDRYQAGLTAVKRLNCDLIIADDAFQHRKLKRDINIVLWDSSHNPKTSKPLPAGYLRESLTGIKRADYLVFTRINSVDSNLAEYFRQYNAIPHYAAPLITQKLYKEKNEAELEISKIENRKVLAFCGLGNPTQFFKTVEKLEPKLIIKRKFPDHYKYTAENLEELLEMGRKNKIDYLITTEKDLANFPSNHVPDEKILILQVKMEINSNLLSEILKKCNQKANI